MPPSNFHLILEKMSKISEAGKTRPTVLWYHMTNMDAIIWLRRSQRWHHRYGQPPRFLANSHHWRGHQHFGAHWHWCIRDHDGVPVVSKGTAGPCLETTGIRHAMTCSSGWESFPTLGCAKVEVGIAAGVYKTPVVSARKERPNFIIGADFLATLREKLFKVREHKVECFPQRVRVSHVTLKLARRVELPSLHWGVGYLQGESRYQTYLDGLCCSTTHQQQLAVHWGWPSNRFISCGTWFGDSLYTSDEPIRCHKDPRWCISNWAT